MVKSRKVLISFLGKGPLASRETRQYRTAQYQLENKIGEYPFISAALGDYYQIDKTILIGTVHSMWEEVYHWYQTKADKAVNEQVWIEIGECCEQANHKSPLQIPHQKAIENAIGESSKIVLIKYGVTNEEIIENINIILGLEEELEFGDELIVDVTHSFRSLPIFLMNLLIYLQNVSKKKITISHIHYGMLEINREMDGVTPIIDLKAIMDVNKWIIGAHAFAKYGNAYTISELMKQEDNSVAQLLYKFSDMMNLNHLYAMLNISQELSGIRNKQYETQLPSLIINPILNDFVNQFLNEKKPSKFQLKVARWQFQQRKYAQAMLTVTEAIVTYVCETNKLDWTNQDDRNIAKKGLGGYNNIVCSSQLKKIYGEIRILRNSTAHAVKTKENPETIISTLENTIKELKF